MKCNGYGHPSDCNCGWGGVYHTTALEASGGKPSIPNAGTKAVWEHADFSRRSTCPKCHQPVFFVRHNGGSVWFDNLGHPWPKHPRMATEPDVQWLQRDFLCDDPENRKVFGVISEATVVEPGISAIFVIRCSDGTVIEEEFVYRQNPCEVVGGLVRLELTPENKVGARRFKAIDDMLEAEKSQREAQERANKAAAKRLNTQQEKERERSKWIDRLTGRR